MSATTADPIAFLTSLAPDERAEFLAELSADEIAYLDAVLRSGEGQWVRREDIDLYDHQQPPVGTWLYWWLFGGRGAGKTWGAGAATYDHVTGPPCDRKVPGGHVPAIVAPTLGDASQSCAATLQMMDPEIREVTRKGGTFVDFPNGVSAKLFGAYSKQDVQRLRGGARGGFCWVWAEEVAAWQQLGYEQDAWDLMRTALRRGPRPRVVASTTPKPISKIREAVREAQDEANRRVVLTRGTMWDNPEINDLVREELLRLYEGTRLEAQELRGELLGDVEGALWNELLIGRSRVSPDRVPTLGRVVVGVDPDFSEEETADEAGIIVAGRASKPDGRGRRHGYVLDDRSRRGYQHWPKAAVEAYHEWGASAIVAESNLGGKDFIRKTILAIDPTVKVETVHATAGKTTRAEPYALLYDGDQIHHVGTFALLEGEQTTWVPGDRSPNRLDALVWALADLYPPSGISKATVHSNRGRSMPSTFG